MSWYIELYGKIFSYPEEEEFREIENELRKRGYKAKVVRGDKEIRQGAIISHIRFDEIEEARMYILTFGGNIYTYTPVMFFAGG